MSVWVCVPSARPVPEVAAWAKRWQAQGYKVALWRDGLEDGLRDIEHITSGKYPGYAQAANMLIAHVLEKDPSCDWTVATGDDTDPDPNLRADEIAAQCFEHFTVHNPHKHGDWSNSTFGVMQPTGDRWGDDAYARARWPDAPAMIDRIAGSPWIGREFARRINGGKGPFWPEYTHCWADEELQAVATKLGVFWQRLDLCHYHHHWMREGVAEPGHLVEANKTYGRHKPLFDRRKAQGFPGSEVIA